MSREQELYAEYVRRARFWGKKIVSSDEFFSAVAAIKDLCASDPLEAGLTEEAWELILT